MLCMLGMLGRQQARLGGRKVEQRGPAVGHEQLQSAGAQQEARVVRLAERSQGPALVHPGAL